MRSNHSLQHFSKQYSCMCSLSLSLSLSHCSARAVCLHSYLTDWLKYENEHWVATQTCKGGVRGFRDNTHRTHTDMRRGMWGTLCVSIVILSANIRSYRCKIVNVLYVKFPKYHFMQQQNYVLAKCCALYLTVGTHFMTKSLWHCPSCPLVTLLNARWWGYCVATGIWDQIHAHTHFHYLIHNASRAPSPCSLYCVTQHKQTNSPQLNSFSFLLRW